MESRGSTNKNVVIGPMNFRAGPASNVRLTFLYPTGGVEIGLDLYVNSHGLLSSTFISSEVLLSRAVTINRCFSFRGLNLRFSECIAILCRKDSELSF